MWKIKKDDDGGLLVLFISGRLTGEYLSELQEALTVAAGTQPFTLDMREVRLVDQDSIAFLSTCEARGAELRNCPAYIREWIDVGSVPKGLP
jgi:anti-anti-sigma regulatory factor